MLVFTRREGEEVVIGDPRNPIGVVRIATIRGDRVRIAFDFPKDVQVNRREIANQIADESAAGASAGSASATGTAGGGAVSGVGPTGSAGANGASGPSVRLNAAQGDGATPEIVAKIQPRATSGH
jgi:carbon storage regulator